MIRGMVGRQEEGILVFRAGVFLMEMLDGQSAVSREMGLEKC